MDDEIRFEYSLFADRVIVEKDTEKVSLIGIFESVAEGPPFVIPQLSYYLRISTKTAVKTDLNCKVFAKFDEEKQVPVMATPMLFEAQGPGEASLVINMLGLPLAGKELIFVIYAGTNELHRRTLKIQEAPTKEAAN